MERPTCICKVVFLLFSCGHEFTRTHSCGASQTLQNPITHCRAEVIFRNQEKCMECEWTMRKNGRFEEEKENAADYLGESGTPDRCGELLGFYEDEDGRLGYNFGYDGEDAYEDDTVHQIRTENYRRSYHNLFEQTRETVFDHAERKFETDTATPQLPDSEYDSHAPEVVSSDEYNLEIAINSYPGEDTVSLNARHSTELVTEWLRAEVTDIPDTSHSDRKDRVLLFPVGPMQNIDDPYDTSASSCGRTSDGTMKQYIPGDGRKPANIDQIRQSEARATTSESVHSTNQHILHRTPHISQPRPYTWPHSQPIHITTPQPLTYRPTTPSAPKKPLTTKFRTTITNSYETVFNKLFTKKGIDGRILQRRSLTITAESRIVGKLSRKGSRAERKADKLRSRMLRKTYGTPGFFEVVASDSHGSFDESEEDSVQDGCVCERQG